MTRRRRGEARPTTPHGAGGGEASRTTPCHGDDAVGSRDRAADSDSDGDDGEHLLASLKQSMSGDMLLERYEGRGDDAAFASFRLEAFVVLLAVNLCVPLYPLFLFTGPVPSSKIVRLPRLIVAALRAPSSLLSALTSCSCLTRRCCKRAATACWRRRCCCRSAQRPPSTAVLHTVHLDTWSLTQYSSLLFHMSLLARAAFQVLMLAPLAVAVATTVQYGKHGHMDAHDARQSGVRWLAYAWAAHGDWYWHCLAAYFLSAIADAIRWSHVTEQRHMTPAMTPESPTNPRRMTPASPTSRGRGEAESEASAVVARLRRATPHLAWSSFGASIVVGLAHLLLPTFGPQSCDDDAAHAPAPLMILSFDDDTVLPSRPPQHTPWQVTALALAAILQRLLAAGMFAGFVSALLYSTRASTYWQLGLLRALDANVKDRVKHHRYLTTHAHIDEWQRLTREGTRLTRTHAKLHRRVAEKLVFVSCVFAVISYVNITGLAAIRHLVLRFLGFSGQHRPASAWIMCSVAVQVAGLVILVSVFLFRWAAVEAALRKQPNVLLLGAEKAAAAGNVDVALRLNALHRILQSQHSPPVVFQVVPASAAFNLIVGATSARTVYQLVMVVAHFLAHPCSHALPSAPSDHLALTPQHNMQAPHGASTEPVPDAMLSAELVVKYLVPVADTLWDLVSKGLDLP